MNPTLRAWSQGSVGDKTFQQISEEFAELIIPKVWEREGRKVSTIAHSRSLQFPILIYAQPSRPSPFDCSDDKAANF